MKIEPHCRHPSAAAAMSPNAGPVPARRRRSFWLAVIAATLQVADMQVPGLTLPGDAPSAHAQAPQRPPVDDPFAEELNPFPRADTAKPRTGQTPRSTTPRKDKEKEKEKERDLDEELTEPLPRKSVPRDERADRGAVDLEDDQPAPRPRPKARPMLPGSDLLPFPDVDMAPPEEDSPAQKLLVKADKLDRKGKYEEAKRLVLEAIAEDPKLPVARLALSIVSRHLGDFEGSVEACSAGLRLDPMNAELYLRRGIAWFHLGRHGIALEDFEDAAGMAYDDPRPELWRGLTLMELDKPLEAISAYSSAIRRDRTYDLAWLNRGLAYLVTDEPSKAELDFDQAIRHDPRDARAWFNRGVAQARQQEYRNAADSYGEALRIDSKFVAARRNLDALRGRNGAGGRPTRSLPDAEIVPAGRPLPTPAAGNG